MIFPPSSPDATFGVRSFYAAPAPPRLDRELQALVTAMAAACDAPIAMATYIDSPRLMLRQAIGLDGSDAIALEQSFCREEVPSDGIFEVEDALQDARFADQPLVVSGPCLRFYASLRLTLPDGRHVGTLCVADRRPRTLTPTQRTLVEALAVLAARAIKTERAYRHCQLLAAELRTLSDLAPFGIYAFDAHGACTFANVRCLEILEATLAETLGDGWSLRIHPEDRNDVVAAWADSVRTGEEIDLEFRLLMIDGRIKVVRSRSRTVRDVEGQIAGHIGSYEDVTDWQAMQRRLAAKRQRLAAIIAATGGATFEWNVATGEMRLDEHWLRLTGERHDEVAPMGFGAWAARIHPEDRPRLAGMHIGVETGTGSPFEIELRRQHADGRWMWILHRGQVISRTPDGSPEWVLGIQLDVTARKHEGDALRRSERLLAKMGAVAGMGGWDLDLLTGELVWTEGTCRIHGLAPGYEPQLAEAINFYAPASRPVIQSAIDTARSTGEGWDLELQLVRADGTLIWVRAIGAVERQGEQAVRLYGAFQDISDRIEQQRLLREEHHRMVLATDSGGIGIWEHDPVVGEDVWDAQMFRLFGHPDGTDRSVQEIWNEAVEPEDRRAVKRAVAQTLATGKRLTIEYRIRRPDGQTRIIHCMGDTGKSIAGYPKFVGAAWDVTEVRSMQEALAEQHRMMEVTMRSIGDAVITTDRQGHVTWLNPIAEQMTGWSGIAAAGQPIATVFRVLNEATLQPLTSPVDTCLAQGKVVSMGTGIILVSRDGREFAIDESAAPIRDEHGQIHGVVLVFHDVTKERRLHSELSYRATHDLLTGLPNRSELEDRLASLLEDVRESGAPHALLFIDLDRFKLVNDACGHLAGDAVLQDVGRILTEAARENDFIARFGGDEFAIVLERCSIAEAMRIAQAICDRMAVYRYVNDGRRFQVGTSIGIAPIDPRWLTAQELVQAADGACVTAKETGRNRVHVWTGSEQGLALRHVERQWVSRLDLALEEDRFRLFVQPLRDLTGATDAAQGPADVDFEVLLRLVEEDGTLVLPGAFIPAAERFNLAPRIDRWVLERVLRFLGEMPSLDHLRTISVNLSACSVSDRAFHADVVRLLRAACPAIRKRLCFEITETAAVSNLADAEAFIGAVHGLGSRVSLDDFGAGATSFGYLRAMSVDQLKIDGQFVQTMLSDPLSEAAVRCFVEVAGVLGITTVAEFVDHPDLVERLRTMGVNQVQGFLIGRPAPIEGLRAALTDPARSPETVIEAWAS